MVRGRGRTQQGEALLEAAVRDIGRQRSEVGPRRLVSIFLGGGTPSLLPPEALRRLISESVAAWDAGLDIEISLEANPDDASIAHLSEIAKAGVNRLSLGVQSFQDEALALLGRNHSGAAAADAVALARDLFPRVSLDLIHSWPGQTPQMWRADLETAIALEPEHISAYELTFEHNTAFGRARDRGRLTPPDEARRADHFALTDEVLGEAGFEAYEVSNHARGRAARARHNLLYWQGEDYVGVGPGAHGRLMRDGIRLASEAPRAIERYIAAIADDVATPWEALSPEDAALERLAMGLRLKEGVPLRDLAVLAISDRRIAALVDHLEVRNERIAARPQSRALIDRLALELVRD